MRQKNKKLQNENQNWGKTIQESENILKRDEKDFDSFINKQRDLYFKVDSIAKKIYGENNYLRKLLYVFDQAQCGRSNGYKIRNHYCVI